MATKISSNNKFLKIIETFPKRVIHYSNSTKELSVMRRNDVYKT